MKENEAIALAESGDVKAMMALAEYYSAKKDNDDAIDLAFKYYEMAAHRGEPNAIIKMAQTKQMMAGISMSMIESSGRIESMDKDIEAAYYWALKLKDTVSRLNVSDRETVEFVEDSLLKAMSRLATLYYLDKKYNDVVRVCKDIDHPYAMAIHGLALFQLDEAGEKLPKAFELLQEIENKLCWNKEFQTKFGQVLLIEAVTYLSALFRVFNKDVDSAYRVMNIPLLYSEDESIRADVRENISRHFKKKMFGGYTYVE